MKKFWKSSFLMLVAMTLGLSLPSCRDDSLFFDGMPYDGDVSLTLDFEFEELGNALDTRATAGNLDFGINSLTVIFYKADDSENTAPAYAQKFNRSQFSAYYLEERPNTHCEPKTYHGRVEIQGIKGDTYRIYGVANVEIPNMATITEKQLREIRINWPASDSGEGATGSPLSAGVPDAMYGYFTIDGLNDHVVKKYRNVIHHNTDLYANSTDPTDDGKDENVNRAKPITLDREHLEMQAWLKRVVSKLTIGYDGSALNNGIEIYIKSVSVKDAAASCFLGHDNSVGPLNDVAEETVSLLDNERYLNDNRFHLVYNNTWGASGTAITRATPAFPRETLDDNVKTIDPETNDWNQQWYERIHGSWDRQNPTYNSQPTTLYFFENLQGCAPSDKAPKLQSKASNEENYNKDGYINGTYVEVKAYYKSSKSGQKGEGNIVYRFMLGKDVERDFNTERNFHYKLTLSFLGDAFHPDWHIEKDKEDGLYFRIPYNLDDEAPDFNYSDEPFNEDWYTNENWKQSYVWYAYDTNNQPIAEIAKELVYYDYYGYSGRDPRNDPNLKKKYGDNLKLRKFYQVVTVYPIDRTWNETDYSKGMIAQVLECDSENPGKTYKTKVHGAKIDMVDRDAKNKNVADNVQWRGDCVIRSNELTPDIANGLSEDSHANYQYVRYDPSDYSLTLIEAPANRRLETRPWRQIDNTADNNYYPIVKIGASYWFRENLKATHYSYPNTKAMEAYRSGVGSFEENGCVYMYDNARMYKQNNSYGCLYNLAAICGTSDNDPWVAQAVGSVFEICQRGTDYKNGENLWKELDADDIDWQITPEGWHIPIAYSHWQPGIYYEQYCDNQYLMDYVSDNLARCMVNKNGYNWPSFPDVTVPNLSGLSLMAIPADGTSTVSFDLDESKLTQGNINGVCVPFWVSEVWSDKPSSKPFYALEPFAVWSNEAYYVSKTIITSFIYANSYEKFYREISKQYLPVRPIRHASLRNPQPWSVSSGLWTGIPQQK